MKKGRGRPIYGHVSGPEDIRRINEQIRAEIRMAGSRPRLTELVKRSHYLVTLTHSPAWRYIDGRLRPIAYEEYLKTCQLANRVAEEKGLGPANYGPGR